MKWPSSTIGSLVDRVATWNPPRDAPERSIEYIDLSAIDSQSKQIVNQQRLVAKEAPSRARQIVHAGDVLVSTVRPNLNGVARVPSSLDGATASTGFCVLRPKAKLHGPYLFHWVKSPAFVDEMSRRASGQSYPAVSDRTVCESQLPLPPLDEQRRIAAILDQADALRCRRRDQLRSLDRLRDATLAEALRQTGDRPLRTIGELCLVQGGKRLPKGSEYSSLPTQYRYIRVSDLVDGRIREADLRYLTPETQKAIRRYTVAIGDIVISIAGSIGLIAEVPKSLSGANLTENAAKLVNRTPGVYDPTFLSDLLRQAPYQQQMVDKTGQVTIGKLALFRIEQIELRLPDIAVQQRFAEFSRVLAQRRSSMMQHLVKLDALFASLQHRAFSGELSPAQAERELDAA